MQYWLVKSEPYVYSFQQLQAEGRSMWEGVRNYQARNNLRAMRNGDRVLFYHSNKGLEVVGICEVVAEAYPDPTATKGDWSVVDMVPVAALAQPVSLRVIKADPALTQVGLVRNPRLSVMPLTPTEYQRILALAAAEG